MYINRDEGGYEQACKNEWSWKTYLKISFLVKWAADLIVQWDTRKEKARCMILSNSDISNPF